LPYETGFWQVDLPVCTLAGMMKGVEGKLHLYMQISFPFALCVLSDESLFFPHMRELEGFNMV
jgi:hypothetical protein